MVAQIGGVVGAAVAGGISGKGGSPQPTPETPDFGAFGYLAERIVAELGG